MRGPSRIVFFRPGALLAPGEVRVVPARVLDGEVVQLGSVPGAVLEARAVVFATAANVGRTPEHVLGDLRAARDMLGGATPIAVVELSTQDSASVRGWSLASGGFTPAPVTVVNVEDAFARNEGVLESRVLADRTAAVIGLGSGGSVVVSDLARAGVGRFLLVDHDVLEVQNVGRHVCGLPDLGRRKTVAMRDHVHARNPSAGVVTADLDVVEDEERLAGLLEAANVILCATDSNRSRRVVNRIALAQGKVAIFGRAFARASGGDVIRVQPGSGPCYECLFKPGEREEVSSTRSAHATAYSDVPVVPEPGLALDIAPIAQLMSRLALLELARGRAPGIESLNEDLVTPYYIHANRRDGRFANWSRLGASVAGQTPLRWYGVRADVDPTCPACQPDRFLASLAARTT